MSWLFLPHTRFSLVIALLTCLLTGPMAPCAEETDTRPQPAESSPAEAAPTESDASAEGDASAEAEASAEADVSAEPAKRVIHEVIIDDSGIIIREGGKEVQVELERDGSSLDIQIRSPHGRSRHELERDDQVSFGEDRVIEKDEIVHNDMVILFGDLRVYGKVVGDIVVVMGDVNLYDGSEVTGDILCVGGEVDREPGAEIIGEITPVSSNLSNLFDENWEFDFFNFSADRAAYSFTDSALRLIEILILAWVGQLLLAARIPRMSAALRRRPGRSVLVGLLTVLAAVLLLIPALLVIVLLVLTLVGIPVAVLAILAIGGLGFLGWLLPLFTFSRYSFEARGLNRYLSVGIWAVIFWFVHMLAHSGGILGILAPLEFVVFLFGIGALVLTRLGSRDVVTG